MTRTTGTRTTKRTSSRLGERAPASDWTIERLVPGGDGFLRLGDGRFGFARGALPGDQVRPLRLVARKGTLRAVAWELVQAGPGRVTPPCPLADRCGGCDWMALARPAELAAKASLLREALRRTGGIADPGSDLSVRVAGRDLGYRGRLRVHFGSRGQVGLLGAASHRVVEVPRCPVGSDELNQALGWLGQLGRTEPRLLGPFAQAELRSAPAEPRLTVHLVSRRPGSREELSAVARALEGAVRVSAQGFAVPDEHTQHWPLSEKLELFAPSGRVHASQLGRESGAGESGARRRTRPRRAKLLGPLLGSGQLLAALARLLACAV